MRGALGLQRCGQAGLSGLGAVCAGVGPSRPAAGPEGLRRSESGARPLLRSVCRGEGLGAAPGRGKERSLGLRAGGSFRLK